MDVAKAKAAAQAVGATVLGIDDQYYPPLLREIYDPPPLLYVRGDPTVLCEAQLAVVGSRRASPAGLRVAQALSGQIVQAGLHICSGLALGVDSAAHRGALNAGGKTVAVMATGIDRVYPRRNQLLADQLEKGGCLVTEFPPGTPPLRQNFPKRNRVISGLSLGALVVEAALPSGSLITARTAMEQGREVFAVPWSMLHDGGKGCLHLIREGAKMVQSVDDILEELGPLYRLQREGKDSGFPEKEAPPTASWLLALVGFEAVDLDELVKQSARPAAQVRAELSALELAGQVTRTAGGYIRC
jgi:DNA processing protein